MRLSAPTEDAPSDADLIERWRAGDEAAATALVERHAAAVGRYLGSLGAREVEELVQDTFVRAFSALDSFRGDSSLRTWLFTIARRLVLDERRAGRRRRRQVEITEGDRATEYDALDSLLAREAERRIGEAVGRLSPTQREVLLLRIGEGLSYKEIALLAGTTEGAARVHYHHALRMVKEYLND